MFRVWHIRTIAWGIDQTWQHSIDVNALMTDFVFRDDMKLHLSMASVAAIGGLLAILLLTLAQKPFRSSIAELADADATTAH